MPKQLYKIVQFHGGLNSNSDARDIAENELSDATDVMVDELGKIRMMGGTSTSSMPAARPNAITPGYGLFQFSHDRIDGHTAGSGAETGTDYLVFSDSDTTGKVSIYELDQPLWGEPITDLANNDSGTGQRKDVFYAVDGALRVCDSEFRNANTNKWYGYIDRIHFDPSREGYDGTSLGKSADTYDTWALRDQEISAPAIGLVGKWNATSGVTLLAGQTTDGTTETLIDSGAFDDASPNTINASVIDDKGYIAISKDSHAAVVTNWTDDNTLTTETTTDWYSGSGQDWLLFPPAGGGFNIAWDEQSPTGTELDWGSGDTYEVATTFIYDGNQESLPYKLNGLNITLADDKFPVIHVYATGPYDSRLTGGRAYYRVAESAGPWKLLADIDLKEGARKNLGASFFPWHDTVSSVVITIAGSVYVRAVVVADDPNLGLTYEALNGISQESTTLIAKYKTAVVANRIAYVGNVQIDGIVYGDMMIKSPVNKFDIFTKDRGIEASVRDGDEIIKLEEYADRILQFKKRKMHLINVSQEIEFLEDTFMHKGVSHHAATCKTDFGIAWVNRQGCYLYDGQKVNNLLEKAGRQIIKEGDWDSFTTDNSIIGYVPKKRQIIVLKDCTTSNDGDIYLFDMVTQSWVKGLSRFTDDKIQTNFVTDWNGDLVCAHTSGTGTIVKWDDAGDDSSAFVIQTKDIDFGQPAQKKKIYKVYVTYTGVSSLSVNVDYQING